jgi:UDP:flavonoid glycosyltransferase YjiC (YdhE family)
LLMEYIICEKSPSVYWSAWEVWEEMGKKRVLFISGSLGLGHVGRDIEIAKAIRKIDANIEISWLADDPASMVLAQAGETLLPEVRFWAHANNILDGSAKDYKANLVKWVMSMRRDWAANNLVVAKLVEKENFDLVIGDEAYEVLIERVNNPDFRNFRFVMIYDAIGFDRVTTSPIGALATYAVNRLWAKGLKAGKSVADRSLFIGEVDDVPDENFGLMLPNKRKLTVAHLDFVGYVLSFNPEDYPDKERARHLLGYGNEPLIICSIGGTSAGKDLLDLCSQAYLILKKKIPELKMVLVCGPLLKPETIQAPEGVEVRGYVPELYKHLAAADLCIVTGGGTVTLELTALKKPFLYFPLKQHPEQEVTVASRCKRHGAGVKMDFSKTTPELLAETALSNLNKKVNYATLPINGTQNAANLINQILNEKA